MSATTDTTRAPATNELVITRIFDAPRELVFKAWTDKAQAIYWMGPREYPVVYFEQDLRPGGMWRARLHPVAGGDDLWQGGVCREVVPPERFVFTFAWDSKSGLPGDETLITITFDDDHGKTRMTFRQSPFESVGQRDGHRDGWNSTFDRLAEHLRAA